MEFIACPKCRAKHRPAQDPVLACRCGTEIVAIRVGNAYHVFRRDELMVGDDLSKELERLANVAEERRATPPLPRASGDHE